jgi:hypothetical protein
MTRRGQTDIRLGQDEQGVRIHEDPRRGALLHVEQDTVGFCQAQGVRRVFERYDSFVSAPGRKW